VNTAFEDGVMVNSAGSPSSTSLSSANNGFEVAGAQGNGLYVGRADESGVRVDSAINGMYVASADYGVSVSTATTHGFHVASTGVDGVVEGRMALLPDEQSDEEKAAGQEPCP
jgi:hypothetical protein